MIYFSLLFITFLLNNTINAMDEPYNPSDEKCLRVARYIALRRSEVDQKTRQEMDNFLAQEHSVAQRVKNGVLTIDATKDMFFFLRSLSALPADHYTLQSCNKDIFVAMCQGYLPKSLEDYGGFFNPENYKGVHKKEANPAGHLLMGIAVGNGQGKKEEIPTISQAEMIQSLQAMDFAKALSVFRYITQKPLIAPSHFDSMLVDSSIKGSRIIQYTPGMCYYFSYDDLQKITPDDEALLQDMLIKFKKGRDSYNIDEFFEIKEKNIGALKRLKEFILNNELLRSIQIRVDMPATTEDEKKK